MRKKTVLYTLVILTTHNSKNLAITDYKLLIFEGFAYMKH